MRDQKNDEYLEEGEVEEEEEENNDLQNEELCKVLPDDCSDKNNDIDVVDTRENDTESYSTLSSKTSTFMSGDNKDNILSVSNTTTSDEFVSVSDDIKDSTITSDKNSSVNISSESNENLYDGIDVNEDNISKYSLKFTKEENTEKGISNKNDDDTENQNKTVINEEISNIKETVTITNKSLTKDIDTREILDVDKENVSDEYKQTDENVVVDENITAVEGETKTYASLKTVDNYYQTTDVHENVDQEVIEEGMKFLIVYIFNLSSSFICYYYNCDNVLKQQNFAFGLTKNCMTLINHQENDLVSNSFLKRMNGWYYTKLHFTNHNFQ